MNSETFRRLYVAELRRTSSSTRAYNRAVVVCGFLAAIAHPSVEAGHLFARATRFRHKATLRRAGLAPVETPADLERIGLDLGVTDGDGLARLLWYLNTGRTSPDAEKRSLDASRDRWETLLTEAIRLLAQSRAA